MLWHAVVVLADAGRGSVCRVGQGHAGFPHARTLQADDGRAWSVHVSTGVPHSGSQTNPNQTIITPSAAFIRLKNHRETYWSFRTLKKTIHYYFIQLPTLKLS